MWSAPLLSPLDADAATMPRRCCFCCCDGGREASALMRRVVARGRDDLCCAGVLCVYSGPAEGIAMRAGRYGREGHIRRLVVPRNNPLSPA